MKRLATFLVISVLVWGPRICSAQAKPPLPAIMIDGQSLLITGLTPGAQAAWMGIGRATDTYSSPVVSRHGIALADGTGRLRLDLGVPIPPRSLWVAVDLATGAFQTAAPGGAKPDLRSPPASKLHHQAGKADAFEDTRSMLEVFLVRKGTGAWTLWLSDGSERDEDGAADGHIRFSLDQMKPLGGSPPAPAKSAAGDLLVAIDPQRLDVVVAPVGVQP